MLFASIECDHMGVQTTFAAYNYPYIKINYHIILVIVIVPPSIVLPLFSTPGIKYMHCISISISIGIKVHMMQSKTNRSIL